MPESRPGPRRINVTFSPPTPNGDFHLGHLAGPVLASDICARSRKIMGDDVVFACSSDDNQTYVVTTAQRLQTSPATLIADAMVSMRGSLELAGIDLDGFDRTDDAYRAYVREFFTHLWKNDVFDRREVELPFDPDSGECKAEAFVTGRCPICLAHARAGVCEACGLYNLPGALLPDDTTTTLPRKSVAIWVLDLERYRSLITERYQVSAIMQRPDLQRVVTDTLASRLPYIPITYPSTWGIAVDWDGPDAPPQAINAWPEIFVGHLYWLARARVNQPPGCDELVQFIGIDNGFYNAFVYQTLGCLAVRHALPIQMPVTRTITNQYFLLEGRKFSTSKGDVVWAHDFLDRLGADRVRFVLALTSPELAQSEFSEPIAASTLQARFDQPLADIETWLNKKLIDRGIDGPPSPWWTHALRASVRRFEEAYALETFSIRRAAEALALHLEVLALRCAQVNLDDASEVAGTLLFAWALRSLAWPICPGLANSVALAFGVEEATHQAPLLRDAAVPPAGSRFRGITFRLAPSRPARPRPEGV